MSSRSERELIAMVRKHDELIDSLNGEYAHMTRWRRGAIAARMYYKRGMPTAEIAELMGVTRSCVWEAMNRQHYRWHYGHVEPLDACGGHGFVRARLIPPTDDPLDVPEMPEVGEWCNE